MKIGFFGDSYVDLVVHRWSETPDPQFNPWSFRLIEHYQSPIINSGLGGSNQYHAINEWNKFIQSGQQIDYVFFTFTWPDRLYHSSQRKNEIFCLRNVLRNQPDLSDDEKATIKAVDDYYQFVYDQDYHNFNHELQVKWILELPEQYPNIKFIFLPNTEHSRMLALKYFQKGVLVNFSFASISELEGETVGQYPFVQNKIGHLTEQNHERFKNKMVDIIDKKLYNTIIDIDYKEFEL